MTRDKCCVSGCNNVKDKPENWIVRGHVTELTFHHFPKGDIRAKWETMIRKALDKSKFSATDNTLICSNHFEYGKPTFSSPHPTEFLTVSDQRWKKSPKRRRRLERKTEEIPKKRATTSEVAACENTEAEEKIDVKVPMQFSQLTRDADVRLFTGISDTLTFKFLFGELVKDAKDMTYWKGEKQTTEPSSSKLVEDRLGPHRKLSLEQEFLLTLMKLRLGMVNGVLAWMFGVSPALVSQIFFTWVRLISLDLAFMIKWPSRVEIRKNLPEVFRKYFPKCIAIIDCTEFFVETPSSLENQALLWSEYKHHCSIKALISITPNGVINYVSDSYGGRCTDKFIVKDSGFLDRLRPGDHLMADRGFKVADLLAFRQCFLTIPPSVKSASQLSEDDPCKTSRIANARIYVENAIGRIKNYKILKNELPMTLLPIFDDILLTCCLLTNLSEPLCV